MANNCNFAHKHYTHKPSLLCAQQRCNDMEYDTKGKVLKKAVVWKELYFYRKSDVIYQLTVEFCKRFLPAHGDRTVDQMVQAARSGKQNIVEGSEDERRGNGKYAAYPLPPDRQDDVRLYREAGTSFCD